MTENADSLNAGKMLFVAFNSLFEKVDTAMADLDNSLQGLKVPQTWVDGVEAVHESRKILVEPLKQDLHELTEISTILARLLVLKDCFELFSRCMLCFKADPSVTGQFFPTGDEMARPVKLYIAEFYRKRLLGVFSWTLSLSLCEFTALTEPSLLENLPDSSSPTKLPTLEITKAYSDRKFSSTSVTSVTLSAESLNHVCSNMMKSEVGKYLQQNIDALTASQRINQLQRTTFQWFHEATLPLEAITLSPPVRSQLLVDLRHYMSVVLLLQEDMTKVQLQYQELYGTVEQRMKWACGANPELHEVFDSFSSAFTEEMEALKVLSTVSKAVCSTANTVLHHEALRAQTTESNNSDSAFVALVAECQNAANLQQAQAQNRVLTDQELFLFNMNPPKEVGGMVDFVIDRNWIKGTEEAIASRVKKVHNNIDENNKKVTQASGSLHQSVEDLRKTVSIHHKLLTDVGALLRAINKAENEYEVPQIRGYLVQYRKFSDLLSEVVSEATAEDLTEDKVRSASRKLDVLKDQLGGVYEGLVDLATLLREENIEQFKKQKEQQSSDPSTAKDVSIKEKKNAFALNVLKRIRAKLDGREPDVLRKSSVQEQVDFIIRESTNLDNLALIYEGWTAWI